MLAVVMIVAGACGGGSGLPGGLEGTWRDQNSDTSLSSTDDFRVEGDRIYCLEPGTDKVKARSERDEFSNNFEVLGVSEDGTRGTFRGVKDLDLVREGLLSEEEASAFQCITGERQVVLDGDRLSMIDIESSSKFEERWVRD